MGKNVLVTEWRVDVLTGSRAVVVRVMAGSETGAIASAIRQSVLRAHGIEGSIRGAVVVARSVGGGPWIPWQEPVNVHAALGEFVAGTIVNVVALA